MIAARPNAIPQYRNTYGADHPYCMKFKLPHSNYQHKIVHKKIDVLPVGLLTSQRNPLDQSLPSVRTPFDNRRALSKLGGIQGFYSTSTQSGKPLLAQKGLGKDDLTPRIPLKNSNF
jgi:hypothetical protein